MDAFLFALQSAAVLSFWLSIGIVLYVYAIYPGVIWICAKVFGRETENFAESYLPPMSIVIAAHNEESVIASRIENLLALDYPDDRLEIIIASDGSTDGTVDIVNAVKNERVRVMAFAENRGKAAVLNDAVAAARGEVVLLSDANTMMDPSAAQLIARRFSNPRVGVVCGRLVLIDPASGRNVDGVYWKYETFLKHSEARLGALLGANGAIYAIRRSAFPTLPHRVGVDDFVVPLLARLRSGLTIEYDEEAIAFEETPAEIRAEFSRRSRIGAGGFQSVGLLWPLLNPRHGWLAFSFASHKLLRWVCPFFLLGAAISSAVLIGDPLYRGALIAQTGLYGIAVAGHFSRGSGSIFRAARLATMFAAMNLALLAGFYRWAAGTQTGTWQRTARITS